jgi:hypothetical protein
MITLKVTNNNGTVRTLQFSPVSKTSVLARYNQLVSEGEILDFEVV